MCLSVPMKVEEIDGPRARCTALGEERWANLTLMEDGSLSVGDYVIIQLGFAQKVVSEEDARKSYELFGEILTALDTQGVS
ncbi:HypC/HybG/HupF family hydrogenase formation chaperone [Pseudomonadota bacterium]